MSVAVNDDLYIKSQNTDESMNFVVQFNYKQIFFFFNTDDVLRLERYLSKQYVLLSTQTTIQDAVIQLRATERDKYCTFILDMACHGSRVILEEVKTIILDKITNTASISELRSSPL
jgi:hypothetical protein